jgi:hypothetical protein
MANLSDFEKMLPALSRAEKAQLPKSAARELDRDPPGIDARPGVCGGEHCVARTRIPGWPLDQARRAGVRAGPVSCLLASARQGSGERLAYARSHAAEIDDEIRGSETA